MSQLSYRDGYRQGVMAATSVNHYTGISFRPEDALPITSILDKVRKKLLTKKVTKWVNVGRVGPSVSDPAAVRFGYGVFYDDKSTAESNVWSCGNYIGTYPVDIEEEY